jgi:hypothetical protein
VKVIFKYTTKSANTKKITLTLVSFNEVPERKKPLRGNGAASNDCLPYEKKLKAVSDRQA